MALAKRGAQTATSRANAIAAEQRGAHALAEEDFGPLLHDDAEAFIYDAGQAGGG